MKKLFAFLIALCAIAAHAQTFPVNNLNVLGAAALTAPPAIPSTCKNILTYGGIPNGVADNTAAWNKAIAANGADVALTGSISGTTLTVSAINGVGSLMVGQTIGGAGVTAGTTITAILTGSGGVGTYTVSASQTVGSEAMTAGMAGQVCVFFPPGTYAFASQITYTAPSNTAISVMGSGSGVSNLVWAAGGGMQINTSNNVNSVYINGLTFTTGSAGSGTGIYLNNTGSSGNAQANLSTISNVLVQGSGFIQTNYWNIGIKINNLSNVNLVNASVVGANAAYQTNGTGVYLSGASNASQTVQVNLYGCVLQYVGTGLYYGNNVEGVTVTATNFTGDATGITVPGPSGAQSGLSITMSQFNSNVNAILDQAGIDGIFIVGNYFELPYNGGSTVVGLNLAKQSSAVIEGNVFERIGASGTGLNGIVIAGPSTLPGMITGNVFESLGTGIWLQNTSDFVNVQSNAYQGNGTNVLNNSGAACPPTTSANCVGGGSQ